jgi:hypothetical protein
MENTGDTIPSIPDLQTAPIKSYQSKLTALLKTDSVDNFLESLPEYDLARVTSTGAARASSWLTSPVDYNQPLSSESFKAPSYGAWACLSTTPEESIGARRGDNIP